MSKIDREIDAKFGRESATKFGRKLLQKFSTCYELSEQYQSGYNFLLEMLLNYDREKLLENSNHQQKAPTLWDASAVDWRTFTSIGTTWTLWSIGRSLGMPQQMSIERLLPFDGRPRSIGTFHCKRPVL